MKTKKTTSTTAASTQARVAPATAKATTKPATVKKAAQKPARAAAKAIGKKKPAAAPDGSSKKDVVIALISRKGGASLAEIMTATAWQKHTVRGFISILGKKGTKIESSKNESGARAYTAA